MLLLHLRGQIRRKSLCITWTNTWGQRRIYADVLLEFVSPLLAIRLSKQRLCVMAVLRWMMWKSVNILLCIGYMDEPTALLTRVRCMREAYCSNEGGKMYHISTSLTVMDNYRK